MLCLDIATLCTFPARCLLFDPLLSALLINFKHIPYPLHPLLVSVVLLHHYFFETTHFHVLWWCLLVQVNLTHFNIGPLLSRIDCSCRFSTIWSKIWLRFLALTGIMRNFGGSNWSIIVEAAVTQQIFSCFQRCLRTFLLLWLLDWLINLGWK